MKKKIRKILITVLLIIITVYMGNTVYSHSGRTDSNGGHKDNKNASGLGNYHYHCGGYPAHLHTNGVCPYSSTGTTQTNSKGSSSGKSTTSNSKTSTGTTSKPNSNKEAASISRTSPVSAPATINANDIQINEKITQMIVGETKQLTTTIMPDNTTNKNITWSVSDNKIITIMQDGKITAIKEGTVDITASTQNGKTNTIKINVKENKNDNKKENTNANNIINTTNNTTDKSESSNAAGSIVTLGLLGGGGGYWGYRKMFK